MITIISPYAWPETGACSIRTQELEKTLQEHGYQTKVLSPFRGQPSNTKTQRYETMQQLAMILSANQPTHIISIFPPETENLEIAKIAKQLKAKLIIDSKEETNTKPKTPFEKLKKIRYDYCKKNTLKNADAVLYLTNEDMQKDINQKIVTQKKAHLLQNGTNNENFYLKAHQQTNKPTLVYAGGIGDERISEMLEYLSDSIRDNKTKLILCISTDNSEQNKKILIDLRIKMHKLEILDQVTWKTNVLYEEMPKILNDADIALLPWNENMQTSLPVKIFDYATSGLPQVIIHANQPIKQLQTQYNFAKICENWTEFLDAINELSQNVKLRQTLGNNGRKMTQQQFDRQKNCKQIIKIIENL